MRLRKPGLLYRLLMLFFVIAGLSGLLRVIGILQQKDNLLAFGLPVSLSTYLFWAGLLVFLCNLAAIILGAFKPVWKLWSAWAAVLCTLGLYWLERLFLWAEDQPRGNLYFVVALHLLILGLMIGFTRQRGRSNGSGN